MEGRGGGGLSQQWDCLSQQPIIVNPPRVCDNGKVVVVPPPRTYHNWGSGVRMKTLHPDGGCRHASGEIKLFLLEYYNFMFWCV